MGQITIKELADAVIAELRRLGYKQSTVHNYEKMYTDLIRYGDEEYVTEYSIEFGEKYLREVRGIDPCYVVSMGEPFRNGTPLCGVLEYYGSTNRDTATGAYSLSVSP